MRHIFGSVVMLLSGRDTDLSEVVLKYCHNHQAEICYEERISLCPWDGKPPSL